MQQESSYNPTTSAFKRIYNKLEYFKDNPLVKQFTLKSFNEITAAEHSYRNKLKTLNVKNPEDAEKYLQYESILETLDMMGIQSINLSADLMFEQLGETIETVDAEVIDDESKESGQTTKKDDAKIKGITKEDVVHNKHPKTKELPKKEEPVVNAETDLKKEVQESIVVLPAFAIPDKAVKATIHQTIKEGESKENLVDWLKEMVAKDMFDKDSRIKGVLERGGEERYGKYIDQFFENPTPAAEEKAEEPKSEVTEIELPEKEISFNKMKEVVKKSFKDNVTRKVVEAYVNQMIHKKLIKGGSAKVNDKKARKDWITNVENGVLKARKVQDNAEKVAVKLAAEPKTEPVFDAEIEDSGPPEELLTACQHAEYALKSGDRDKAIGIIKHYLGEFGADAKGAFKDLDIQRLLNWIDEDTFHHRNPMDLLHDIPLSLTDVIKEVEKQVKSSLNEDGKIKEGSRKAISDLIFSKIDGVKMREMKSNDDIIKDKKEFNVWFEANCGFVFRVEKLETSFDKQVDWENSFEDEIRNADSTRKGSIMALVRKYKKGAEKFDSKLNLNDTLKIIRSKLEALNPELFKLDTAAKKEDKSAKAIPLTETAGEVIDSTDAKTDKDGASETDDSREGSPGSEDKSEQGPKESISKRNPKLWEKTLKLKSIEGLTNFILKNQDVPSDDLYGLARELITSGKIEDASTVFKEGEAAVPWDLQYISNWFRLGPAMILESMDLFQAKNSTAFKKALSKFRTQNASLEQEEIVNKVLDLIIMNVAIRHNYVRKQAKRKDAKLTIQKLLVEALEENHVHTT